jgi:predicted Zn-dependent peptidase
MIPVLYEIADAATLRACSTEKFKSGSLTVSSVMPIDRENACLFPLLLSVLRRGTEKYPTLSDINKRLDYLFGTTFAIRTVTRGNCLIVGFCADLLDPAYLPDGGEEITDGVLELMEQILFHPLLDEDGLLLDRYVESEKRMQRDTIRAARNNPRSYAAERCKSLLLEGEPGGISLYGSEEETMAVTREELTAFWRRWIGDLHLDCFYVGGEAPSTLCDKLRRAFGDRLAKTPGGEISLCGKLREGRGVRVEESMPVSQSQLLIGLNLQAQIGSPDDAVAVVLNELLGNSPISKLFVNVRERLSLCYSCASVYSAFYGNLLIACGLRSENRERAEREILRQVQSLSDGDFTDAELDAAKKSLENAYRQVEDSPGGLENYYYGRALVGSEESLRDRRDAFSRVSREDVVRLARTISLDVTYFLEGTLAGGEEDCDDED